MTRSEATSQPYMGVYEIAVFMGVTVQAVNNRRNRGRLPPPTASLKMGHIWATSEIVRYLEREAHQ